MKLPNTPQSLWMSSHPSNPLPPLPGDLTVDVAIIGAGITGLTAALHLVLAGLSVVVIDAGAIAEGATGHCTAHLTEALDAPYTTLERTFGHEGASLAAESTRAAIDDIARIARLADIPCTLRRVPGFLFTESSATADLEAELDAAARAGATVTLTNLIPLSFARAALRFEDQAQMHPREYVLGLARFLASKGVRIFERTRCLHVHERTRHRVITDRGVLRASRIFFATHGPLGRPALTSKLVRYDSYVVAFAAAGTAPEGIFWDTEEPYHSIRTQVVGDSTLLLVGGEAHAHAEAHAPYERFARLAAYAQERFGVDAIHFAWSGQLIASVDGLPYIGASPDGSSSYLATGFGGNGLTFGTLAGRIVSDAILGRDNPYAALYSPSRVRRATTFGPSPARVAMSRAARTLRT